ncbi:MAG TPA: hypothetical protein DCQ06_01300 [Myxococcales bacterium]|nr:hypothetical protein [Myxococcales bacterium]HAN30208.1 hypothetical protein [Myxococcales bacterium]
MVVDRIEELIVRANERLTSRRGRLRSRDFLIELQMLCWLQKVALHDRRTWDQAMSSVGLSAGCWLIQLALAAAALISIEAGETILTALPGLPGVEQRSAYFHAVCHAADCDLMEAA